MATANHGNIESSISSDALGLLDCFTNGLDDVIYEIAEAIAARRTGSQQVEITRADIKEAANVFVVCLETAEIPAPVRDHVRQMLHCLSEQIKSGKC